MFRNHIACVALVALPTASASALVDSLISVIDFEEYAENTAIGTEYASQYGVTFSLVGGGLPIIAEEDGAVRAFGSADGNDNYMSSGKRGLTDPVGPGGNATASPRAIVMTFDPPVTFVSFYVVDVDSPATTGPDQVVSTAFFRGSAGASIVTDGFAANDGKSSLVTLSGEAITRVEVTPSNPTDLIGWALDFLTIARPCPVLDCTPRFRLSQESAPAAGDFAAHVLGEVPMWQALGTSPTAFYGYGVPEGSSWNGAVLTPIAQRSHLFGAITSSGPMLAIVHDRAIPDDPDGGNAEMRFELVNDPNGAAIVVQDDPTDGTDFYEGAAGGDVFSTRHAWLTCCTDGVAIGDLGCGSSVIVQFTNVDSNPATPTIFGLDDWVAYGANGSQIPLALVADRRVRVDLLPPASCPADFTCDGAIDGADLGVLLGAWGSTFGAPDIDGSGVIDGGDLGTLLGLWGDCP